MLSLLNGRYDCRLCLSKPSAASKTVDNIFVTLTTFEEKRYGRTEILRQTVDYFKESRISV
uniref:Uncharacterized protein n=1 Tax=Arion vulgaris TaxID=1028688 RepID=A0A0B6YE54_9EUPU